MRRWILRLCSLYVAPVHGEDLRSTLDAGRSAAVWCQRIFLANTAWCYIPTSSCSLKLSSLNFVSRIRSIQHLFGTQNTFFGSKGNFADQFTWDFPHTLMISEGLAEIWKERTETKDFGECGSLERNKETQHFGGFGSNLARKKERQKLWKETKK